MAVADRSEPGSNPRAKHGRIGPYSKWLRSGARGRINGASAEGRYLRDLEAQLTEFLGGNLTLPQKLLVSRLARTHLRMELLDEKIAAGTQTDLDIRTLGGLSSQFRLMLREIGLEPKQSAEKSPASLADHIARRVSEREPETDDDAA